MLTISLKLEQRFALGACKLSKKIRQLCEQELHSEKSKETKDKSCNVESDVKVYNGFVQREKIFEIKILDTFAPLSGVRSET